MLLDVIMRYVLLDVIMYRDMLLRIIRCY